MTSDQHTGAHHQQVEHGSPVRRGRRVVWSAGLLVAVGAGVATAHGLYEVAIAAGVPTGIAWLYPAITDGLALVAYGATARLSGRAGQGYAWTIVVLAAGLSGLAQASLLAGGVHAAPVQLRFGVGAWPAVAAAITAHLLHLLADPTGDTRGGRHADEPPSTVTTPGAPPATADDQLPLPDAGREDGHGDPGPEAASGDDVRPPATPGESPTELGTPLDGLGWPYDRTPQSYDGVQTAHVDPSDLNTAASNDRSAGTGVQQSRTTPSDASNSAYNPASNPSVELNALDTSDEPIVQPDAEPMPAGLPTENAGPRDRAVAAARAHRDAHGGALPTVSALMGLAEVSRGTAGEALKHLRAERPGLHIVPSTTGTNPRRTTP